MKHISPRNAGLICVLLAVLGVFAALAQSPAPEREYYKYYYKTKIPFSISTQKIAVIFEDGAIETQKQGVAGAEAAIARLAECRDAQGRVQVVELKPGLVKADVETVIQRATNQPGVRFATPVLVSQGGGRFVPNGDVIVRFAKDATDAEIAALNGEYGAVIDRKYDGMTPPNGRKTYLLRVPNPKHNNPLDVANRYCENPRVLWAEPDGYDLSARFSGVPNDPWFPRLPGEPNYNPSADPEKGCNFRNILANIEGHDIHACDAWDIQTGSGSNVVIAFMDDGCYLDHPDLHFWESPADGSHGFDFYNWNSNPPEPPNETYDGHGTAAAGIAAANTNNGVGVAGACWGAHIMALKVWQATMDGWMLASYYQLHNAFEYAVYQGAEVVACNWLTSPATVVTEAIEYAKTSGRNGKGCVVVFSAGNNESPICWPASLPEVIAVGGTDKCDRRWVGGVDDTSAYGAALDLVAPYRVWTTSVPDKGLYEWRQGTCFACPQVAGAAGLLIAEDPNLTASQIQAILQFSGKDHASDYDQQGNPNFDSNDTNGRDYYYGYGRLDVRKALEIAQEPRTQFNSLWDGVYMHKASFFHESGHLVLEGEIFEAVASINPQDPSIWVLKNDSGTAVARLDLFYGDLYLKGTWLESQTNLSLPANPLLVIRNSSQNPVAYIDTNGNLRVKGRVFLGKYPDRTNSQGMGKI
jgi:subtilisin family serine protease